jgi:hypothetical protein
VITLVNGNFEDAAGNAVNGSLQLRLNLAARVVANPSQVVAATPILFSVVNGNLSGTCQVYSNAELLPQNATGLATLYFAALFDQSGARLSDEATRWQFSNPAGSVVDISGMIPIRNGN